MYAPKASEASLTKLEKMLENEKKYDWYAKSKNISIEEARSTPQNVIDESIKNAYDKEGLKTSSSAKLLDYINNNLTEHIGSSDAKKLGQRLIDDGWVDRYGVKKVIEAMDKSTIKNTSTYGTGNVNEEKFIRDLEGILKGIK
jgi:hypothetical protein